MVQEEINFLPRNGIEMWNSFLYADFEVGVTTHNQQLKSKHSSGLELYAF